MRYFNVVLLMIVSICCAAQEVAFTLPEKYILPEGITVDPTTGDFYLSSIFKYKIVKVSKGKVTDFIPPDYEGFMGGVGLHVDSKRRVLWACSGNIMGNKFRRAIHAFDMNTGKVLKKVVHPTDTARRFFNDLVIADDGSIYITDTYDHSVWKWGLDMESPNNTSLGPVKLPLDLKAEYANGITISPDNEFLFVATAKGLMRVNITTNHAELLQKPAGSLPDRGLDGIEFYKGSIVGVYNEPQKNSDMKVIRYYLSSNLDAIERTELIDVGNKHFAVPTTLAILHNEVYVIANSQLDNLDQESIKIIDPSKLKENVVLKYRLRD